MKLENIHYCGYHIIPCVKDDYIVGYYISGIKLIFDTVDQAKQFITNKLRG